MDLNHLEELGGWIGGIGPPSFPYRAEAGRGGGEGVKKEGGRERQSCTEPGGV